MKQNLIYVLIYFSYFMIIPTNGYKLLQLESKESTEQNTIDTKRNSIASKVEDLVKQEFAVDLQDDNENNEFNKTLTEEQVHHFNLIMQ